MSDYGIQTQPPNGIPSNQYLPPNPTQGVDGSGNNGSTGLPFMLTPDPYGNPNVDRSTVPGAALPGFDQYNSNIFGFNQALNNGLIQGAPQFALNQNSRESLANQIAMLFGSQSQQSGYLNQDYSQGLARLGLQNDQLGVQYNNLGLDRSQLGVQYGQLGIQRDQLGIQQGANARQPQYLTALHELANQAYNQQAATNTRGVNSSATARGAFGSAGQNYALSDIQASLANQLGGEAQRYYENMAQVNDQGKTLDNQGRQLDAQGQLLDISGKRLDNQNQMLDIQAKSLGIDRDALKTQLERGLDRLGLSTSMSVADLTDKLNSSQIQDQILAQQIFNQAIQNSDYYAQFYSPNGAPVPGQSNGTTTSAIPRTGAS